MAIFHTSMLAPSWTIHLKTHLKHLGNDTITLIFQNSMAAKESPLVNQEQHIGECVGELFHHYGCDSDTVQCDSWALAVVLAIV